MATGEKRMTIRTGGGLASPVVKAVLGALGVSYIVEQGSDENGNWWRRFSNGWVEQGGLSNSTTIILPIEFANTSYSIQMTSASRPVPSYPSTARSTTKFTVSKARTYDDVNGSNNSFWEANGFAA